jgi:hypothetical protein
MRKLWLLSACLVIALGMGCRKEAATPETASPATPSSEQAISSATPETAQPAAQAIGAALAAGGPTCQVDGSTGKTVCTIYLTQDGEKCSVYPDYLHIESGYEVTWDGSGIKTAQAADFKEVGSSTLHFAGGKPSHIAKGNKFPAGAVTGANLQAYHYEVSFKGIARRLCGVDPVICIKTGSAEDTCN